MVPEDDDQRAILADYRRLRSPTDTTTTEKENWKSSRTTVTSSESIPDHGYDTPIQAEYMAPARRARGESRVALGHELYETSNTKTTLRSRSKGRVCPDPLGLADGQD